MSILFLNYQNDFNKDYLIKLKDNLEILSRTKDGTTLSKVALIYHNINEKEKSLELYKQSVT
ncbi:MAG: hypothetical protein VW988_05480, partial [Gammaproteobacteria bacterium]